ncbi:hypothetical protein [Methanococcus maripaludis]|uniref:Uncharacterized protein n=1 Tax=Methanococcus maripaludis TaxID=39152 RepID=A0A7J9PTY3_METMI|nr:hypothetical protein [Methanococcus maripaludis]MBA2869047.1 hypothetical protein [Methanococcus maripaludis]
MIKLELSKFKEPESFSISGGYIQLIPGQDTEITGTDSEGKPIYNNKFNMEKKGRVRIVSNYYVKGNAPKTATITMLDLKTIGKFYEKNKDTIDHYASIDSISKLIDMKKFNASPETIKMYAKDLGISEEILNKKVFDR